MAGKRKKDRQRGRRRKDRHERHREMHKGGGEWDAIIIPEGLEVFKPEGGKTYHIDVIPYQVGNYNKAADPGDEWYELTYWVYNGLGIEDRRYVAIGEMCGQRDPVAEHFAHLRKSGADWDDMKPFKATKRQLMLIFVHELADKGLLLWEGGYGTLGKELADEIEEGGEADWIEDFDDPDGGATAKVRFKAEDIGMKNKWVKASRVDLIEREDGFDADGNDKLAAEILKQAEGICLDTLLKIPDYDTLKKALDGEPLGEDDDEEHEVEDVPSKGRRARATRDVSEDAKPKKGGKGATKTKSPTAEDLGIEKGEEVEHEDYGTCTVIRISKDGRTLTLMDEEDEVHKKVDVADVESAGNVDDGEEDDEPLAERKSKGASSAKSRSKKDKDNKGGAKDAKTKSHSDDEEDEEWDDWEEE